MRRLLLVVAFLAFPATAGAAPVSVPGPEGIAIAASGDRVVWVENRYEDDELAIRMRGAGGGGARLGTIKLPDATDGEVTASIGANGLGYLIALTTGEADMIVRGAWGGAPETLLDCRGRDALPNPPRVAAGATGFAFAGARCVGAGKGVDTVGITGAPVPVPALSASESYDLAYAEPFVATVGDGLDVVDLRSGERRHEDTAGIADGGSQFGLLSDGTAITGSLVGDGSNDEPVVPEGVYAWPPGADRLQLVATRGYIGGLAAGGRSVFVESERGLEVIGIDDHVARKVGAPGLGSADTPLGFDGRTAAFRDTTCFGKEQTTWMDVTEPSRPGAENGCPVSMYTGDLHFGPSGRTTLAVRCRNGCRAVLNWHAQGPASFCRIPPTDIPNPFPGPVCGNVASAKLDLGPSRRTRNIPVRLTAEGRRARRQGFHRVPVMDTELGSLGLGYHRLVSRLIFL